MGGETEENFWKALGGKPASISPAEPDEESKGEEDQTKYRLWRVSDMTGSIKVDEIKERPLRQSMLDTKESFILELYNVVYVWQGHDANIQEKRCGVTLANKYTKEWKKPKGTQISRIP